MRTTLILLAERIFTIKYGININLLSQDDSKLS